MNGYRSFIAILRTMFLYRDVTTMTDVFAVKSISRSKGIESSTRSIVSMCVAVLCISTLTKDAMAATRQDLQDEIINLKTKVSVLQTKIDDLSVSQNRLIGRYLMTTAGSSPLFVVGISTSAKGEILNIPIFFIPGPDDVSSLQQDIVVSSSFTLISVTAGLAAVNAGKNVQVNSGGGIARMIVFGLNQTAIDAGVLAILKVQSALSIPNGIYPIEVISPVASDGNGIAVPLSATSGWVKIQ